MENLIINSWSDMEKIEMARNITHEKLTVLHEIIGDARAERA